MEILCLFAKLVWHEFSLGTNKMPNKGLQNKKEKMDCAIPTDDNFHQKHRNRYVWVCSSRSSRKKTQNQSSLITFYYTKLYHFSHRLKALSCCSTKYDAFYYLNCHMCTPFTDECDDVLIPSAFFSVHSLFIRISSLWLLCFCLNSSHLWHRWTQQ